MQLTHYFVNGKRVKSGTPGAEKRIVEGENWYSYIEDVDFWRKRVCLGPDREAAEAKLARIQAATEQRRKERAKRNEL